ncbi:MAG: 5'/3'-nucleotidase SurE [Myxococcota bacterium]
MSRPRILLSNDDGIHAHGLHALREAMQEIGEVTVVAPEQEQSAVSRAITLHRGLRMRHLAERTFTVDGTPTDCIYLAIHKVMAHAPPHIVISGVNHGGNLGDDVLYSGTASAAFEGANNGIPAIAVSRVGGSTGVDDFRVAASFARSLASHVLQHGLAKGLILNVNVPKRATSETQFRFCALGKHSWRNSVEERKDPRGKPYFWIGGEWDGHQDLPGTDCNAIAQGIISVTPVRVSLTDTTALSGMMNIDQLPGFTCAPPDPPLSRS